MARPLQSTVQSSRIATACRRCQVFRLGMAVAMKRHAEAAAIARRLERVAKRRAREAIPGALPPVARTALQLRRARALYRRRRLSRRARVSLVALAAGARLRPLGSRGRTSRR